LYIIPVKNQDTSWSHGITHSWHLGFNLKMDHGIDFCVHKSNFSPVLKLQAPSMTLEVMFSCRSPLSSRIHSIMSVGAAESSPHVLQLQKWMSSPHQLGRG